MVWSQSVCVCHNWMTTAKTVGYGSKKAYHFMDTLKWSLKDMHKIPKLKLVVTRQRENIKTIVWGHKNKQKLLFVFIVFTQRECWQYKTFGLNENLVTCKIYCVFICKLDMKTSDCLSACTRHSVCSTFSLLGLVNLGMHIFILSENFCAKPAMWWIL